MSDRDPRHEDELEPEVEPGLASGAGGELLIPTDTPIHHDSVPDVGVTDVDDHDAPEGDDGLLNPRSPEFERLTKPARRTDE